MILQPKRERGKRDVIGKNKREILRIIHLHKDKITESEIRDIARDKLNIRDKTVIRVHLKNLEKDGMISHISNHVINTWESRLYSNINADLTKNGILPLTDSEYKLIDFVIDYSQTFLLVLMTAGISKTYIAFEKINRIKEIAVTVDFFYKQIGITENMNNNQKTHLIGLINMCLFIDLLFGLIDNTDTEFWDDYRNIMSFVIDKEVIDKMTYISKYLVDLIQMDGEKSKDIESISRQFFN